MLHLLIGKDWTVNSDALMDKLARDVRAEKENVILLVPELISHDTERRLCSVAGDKASRYAEVLSFSRLARRVAGYTGCAAVKCMDQGGRLVTMAAAARQLHGTLKTFASVQTRPEFLSMMVDAVDEFKRCCITPEDLQKAAKKSSGELAQKTEELALLYQAYDALCANGKRDPRDLMNWVLETLEDSDFAENHLIYMDAFPDLTRQHLAVLAHFIRHSPSVTVSLNCDTPGSGLMAFEKAGDTAAQLIKIAKAANVPYTITVLEQGTNQLQPVREFMFQGKITAVPEIQSVLKQYVAPSIHGECQAAAAQIRRLVQGGCRYRDISIVCPQMEVYRAPLSRNLRRFGVPFYMAGTESVLDSPAISTIFAALRGALEGFEQKTVLQYLRGVLSPLDADSVDLVENYAYVWNIHGAGWCKPWENHPEGFSDKWTQINRDVLHRAERGRAIAVAPLEQLRKDFTAATKLSQQVDAIYRFFEQTALRSRLEKLAEKMDAAGDNRSAQIFNQLWEILLQALEQLRDILGETVWDDTAFMRLLSLLISQYQVGTIPTVLDAVHVGQVSAMRCQRQKHLILLGCEEGSLPGYSGSSGILSDRERDSLRALELPLTGGAIEGIQAEFAEVYGVFCGATETVTLYHNSAQPSYVCTRLVELSGADFADVPETFASGSQYDAAMQLHHWNAGECALDLGVSEAYEQLDRNRNYQLDKLSSEQVTALYGKKLHLSASQIDEQASCRLHYFLKYGLKLRERREAKVDALEFGNFVHYVLEHTTRDVQSAGGFDKVSVDDTLQIARNHASVYATDHFGADESARLAYQLERNIQELDMIVRMLWDEMRFSAYVPVAYELGFGSDEALQPIEITGGNMDAQVDGRVDRVDVFEEDGHRYFRVIDYKTGKKQFDLCNVFNGVGLQMLLYMYALENSGYEQLGEDPLAAGVQYFSARVPYENDEIIGEIPDDTITQISRRGMLLHDDLSLNAMDSRENHPTYSTKASAGKTPAIVLADGNQLGMLKKHIFEVLTGLVDQIASGNVEPNPLHRGSSKNICSYCPYTTVCHKHTVQGIRNYKSMDPVRFWEEIEKEVGSHG